jgi:hypothetical protein
MKSINRRESKKIAVMAAVIIGLMMFAFMPLASAEVTSFTVTPSSGIAGLVDSYDALVTTDGVTTINVTIPAGFIAVAPAIGGVQIARVDFWNESKGDYYGYATITSNNANPTTQVDVYAKMQVGGDEVEYGPTPQVVDYTPGGYTPLKVEEGTCTLWANTTLPTETEDGYINITVDCLSLGFLEDVSVNIGEFVRNPMAACDYVFSADGKTATVSIKKPIGRGAVFRDGLWYADRDGDHQTDIWYQYGIADDKPAVGDVDNNGINDIVAFRNGLWYVSREDHTGTNWAKSFTYGVPGDIPLIGDIDNDGIVDAVIFRNGMWYVSKFVEPGHDGRDTDYSFNYGVPGDIPVLADIDNDGVDDVVIFRNGKWYVSDEATHQVTVDTFYYGVADDIPIVDDIRNDGSNDIAILRGGRWWVSRLDLSGTDYKFMYGIPGDYPILNKFCSV